MSFSIQPEQKFEAEGDGQSLKEDEREELKRLRKENKELRMEKEILKSPVSECRTTSSRKK